MEPKRNTIQNCRIITDYGSNERNGIFLRVRYEMQEDDSAVGVPMELYTGRTYERPGAAPIKREQMFNIMKICKVPDDDMVALFGEESTSADGGAANETTSTDGNAQMPQPNSSETTGTDKGEAVTTGEAALADTDKSQKDEDKGTTSAVHDPEVKVETKKTLKNRNKRQRQRATAKLKAKESESKTTVGNTSAAAPTQSDSNSLIDVLTSGHCLCCGNMAQKTCAKCQKTPDQISYYCSMKCWDEHLSVHKQICSLVKPQKMFPNSSSHSADKYISTYGIFLPEGEGEGAKLSIVDVKSERKQHFNSSRYYSVNASEYLGSTGFPNFIKVNTLKPNRVVPNLLIIYYAADELLPVGKELDWNECVNIISGGKEVEDWDGPILIIKSQGKDVGNLNPIDVDLSDDFIDIIDHFKTRPKYTCEG